MSRRRKRRRVDTILLLVFLFYLIVVVDASFDPYSDLSEEVVPVQVPKRKEKAPNFADEDRVSKVKKGPSSSFDSFSNSESLFIHLVPHSHIDHGWLRSTDNYEETAFEILSSVTQQLDLDSKRRFVWAETWYFRRWFDTLGSGRKDKVRRLVKEGRLEFVGGGLVQHDETLSTQRLVMEQVLEGHQFIEQNFGVPSPRIAWQIDAFGHSDATPGILSRLGFSVVVLNRVHFRVKQRFRKGQHLEFIWRGPKIWDTDSVRSSSSNAIVEKDYGDESHQIFAHLLPYSYSSPEGTDFEKTGARQVTAPRGRASKLLQYARELSKAFRTHHVMIPLGDDLRFREADKQFINMDKIIAEIAAENPTVKIQYSTATEYFEALQKTAASSSLRFPLYYGDFLPYADSGDAYWTGLYSFRPALKKWARQLEVKVCWAGTMYSLARAKASMMGNVPRISTIEESGRIVADDTRPAISWGVGLHRALLFSKRQALLIGTHHHAITGQAKENVIKDFTKRAKTAFESASKVGMEALSILVTKRKIDFQSAGPHVKPPLKAWSPNDALELKEDGRQWPLIFTNDGGNWRREIVTIRLDCSWTAVKKIKVVDGATGHPVSAQVHKSLVSSSSENEGGWKTDTHLHFLVEIPPLGFNTYFISSSSNSERLTATSQQSFAASVQIQVFDMLDGRIIPFSGSKSSQFTEGVKISQFTPSSAENQNGACSVIDNDHLLIEMDCETSLIKAMTDKKTKKRILLRQEFRVHESSRGGSALFRPDRLESTLLQIGDKGRLTIGIVKGPLVQEVQILADGISQQVRLVRAPHGADAVTETNLEGHVFVSHAVAGTNPDVDTVVRYSTDLKTSSTFFTDNPSGALKERKGQTDVPLAANFFPCSNSLILKSTSQIFGIILNQPLGCTGAANIASGGGEFGTIELMLHRNPSADDGRGLGEGLTDFGVSRMETLLFADQVEAGLSRRPLLISRLQNFMDIGIAQLEYSTLLSSLLSKEIWASRFLMTASFLKRQGVPSGLKLISMFPRDETSDDVLVRLEISSHNSKFDFSDFFNSEEIIVSGSREYKLKSASGLSFHSSERPDDFHASGLDSSDFGSSSSAGYVLSEHAMKELSGDSDASSNEGNSIPKSRKGNSKEVQTSNGGALPSCPNIDEKWRTFAQSVEMRKGDSKLFIVGLLALPDDRVAKKGPKKPSNLPASGVPPSLSNFVPASLPSIPPKHVTISTEKVKMETIIKDDPATTSLRTIQENNNQHYGKSLSSLRAELIAEEKRSAALEVRSRRLQQNVDDLLQELDLFQDIDGGLDKKAALDELSRAKEQLVEGNLLLKESKEKVIALQRELDHGEALDELQNRHPRRRGESDKDSSSATLHGVFAGAGGMLVFVIAAQWLMTGRRRPQQAFVPVRYVPVHHGGASFALPVKRL